MPQHGDSQKIIKRVAKNSIFVLISAAIAHLFLAYFVSIPELYRWMTTSPTEHWGAFVFMFVATAIIYFNFAWFREQLCLVICPYGRLQSALIDDDSLIIGYDEKRGEPRGPAKKEGFGDCINCYRCVQVCPTGIDIRQGLQMECVGCSNCIDACDTIMDKLNRPKGADTLRLTSRARRQEAALHPTPHSNLRSPYARGSHRVHPFRHAAAQCKYEHRAYDGAPLLRNGHIRAQSIHGARYQ